MILTLGFNKLLTFNRRNNMKMTKLIYPLVFALAIAVASTGCKHKPGPVTKLPGTRPAQVGDNTGGNTLPPGNTVPPDSGVNPNGNIPVANAEDFENMTMDRAALAAYTIHFAF